MKLIEGEAEPFHVVLVVSKAAPVKLFPILVFLSWPATTYRLTIKWESNGIRKRLSVLFEIMLVFESFGKNTVISHEGNIFEQNNELISAYRSWGENCAPDIFKVKCGGWASLLAHHLWLWI